MVVALGLSPCLQLPQRALTPCNSISGLELGEHAGPTVPDGWTTVSVRATALNHHDVWSLRGVGLSADQMPMILGSDAAGVDEDGNDVVVHAVIGDPAAGSGDETLDPKDAVRPSSMTAPSPSGSPCRAATWCGSRRNSRSGSSVPADGLPHCLPDAVRPGSDRAARDRARPGRQRRRRDGPGQLGKAAGYRMWVTGRSEEKRDAALQLGAEQAFETGARLPERVDAVMETVGRGDLGAFSCGRSSRVASS